ncbi:MAG TPA: hypothetical protein VFH73_17345 [Polyangia bacterium]|jgi:hypothetical protein|nr:hypothetical protein [Polyangia bacterium]
MLVALLTSWLLGADACVDATWKEGIVCGTGNTCPEDMHCCRGACWRKCPPVDAAPAFDVAAGFDFGSGFDFGPGIDFGSAFDKAPASDAASDPDTGGGEALSCAPAVNMCVDCTPGCACTCGVIKGTCCMPSGGSQATCSVVGCR